MVEHFKDFVSVKTSALVKIATKVDSDLSEVEDNSHHAK